jgi:transcription factor IIIB 90 kDa subunit
VSNAHGATAAESVRNFVTKNKKFSRKINYSAYDTLFGGTTITDTGNDKDADDDDGLYHLDDKSDGEAMVVIEESGGGVGARKPARKPQTRRTQTNRDEDGDGDKDGDTTMDASAKAYSDDDQDADGEKDDDTWGAAEDVDLYEQEV